MKSRLLILIVFAIGMGATTQAQLNNYKYIIVPKKFDIFNKENKYQTSTLVKYLFAKKGFNAVYDDSLPEELANNRCMGLRVELEDTSNMFTTKMKLVLTDCQEVVIYKTPEGISKIKEFRDAYKQSITSAFEPIQFMDYTYEAPAKAPQPEVTEEPIVVSFKNDVKSVGEKPNTKVVQQVATPENQSFKSMEPVASNMKKVEKKAETTIPVLYAQPIENGYQLVDSTPKVVLKMIKTSVDNIYLVDDDTKSGMVFKKGDKWFLEYADASGKKQEELNIKF
nr:hypothetical protein [Allomuricauda sp.]